MGTDADKDKHFPFFELPRELRDHIYDYVGGVAVQPRVPGFAGYIKAINPYPKSQLLQVGKQFALEYADASQFTQAFASIELDGQVWNESKKHSWLKIDRVDDRLSSLLRKITRVNITLRHPTYVANDGKSCISNSATLLFADKACRRSSGAVHLRNLQLYASDPACACGLFGGT